MSQVILDLLLFLLPVPFHCSLPGAVAPLQPWCTNVSNAERQDKRQGALTAMRNIIVSSTNNSLV
jgi:PDZ domain-containing secreted protein